MELLDIMVLSLLAIFLFILIYMLNKNAKLNQENQKLQEILAIKNSTIQNYEASRVSVKEVVENISATDKVINAIKAGDTKEEISKKLNIPLAKIDLIIKFDGIKRGE
jgi:tRNA threonylcarbamoyladenosine modification (KEOPS) complex Cgi121 subunit